MTSISAMRNRATRNALLRKAWAFACSSSSPLKSTRIRSSRGFWFSQPCNSRNLSSANTPSSTSAFTVMTRRPSTRLTIPVFWRASRLTKFDTGTAPDAVLILTALRPVTVLSIVGKRTLISISSSLSSGRYSPSLYPPVVIWIMLPIPLISIPYFAA